VKKNTIKNDRNFQFFTIARYNAGFIGLLRKNWILNFNSSVELKTEKNWHLYIKSQWKT